MDCPKCGGADSIKDGKAKGRQRYYCKSCGYRYTVNKKSDVKPIEIKKLALELYLEGLGFRAIGRVLKISYGTVFKWIRDWGSQVSMPKTEAPVAVMELDEMRTYVRSKKTIVGYGLLLIDLQDGSSHLCVDVEERKRG